MAVYAYGTGCTEYMLIQMLKWVRFLIVRALNKN